MPDGVKISVVVPAYNEEKYIGECIKSLLAQDFDKSKLEIVIVDNNSKDKTAEVIKSFPVKYLNESAQGKAHALNKGCAEATGEILMITDADCIPPSDWVSKTAEFFKKNHRYDSYGGVYYFPDFSFFTKLVLKYFGGMQYFASGGNMSFTKKAFSKIHGYDTAVNYGEDLWMQLRFKKAGFKCRVDTSNKVIASSRRYKGKPYFLAEIPLFLTQFSMILFNKPLFRGKDLPTIR